AAATTAIYPLSLHDALPIFPGTISTMTDPLGVSRRWSSRGAIFRPTSRAAPIVISVSPSQSGRHMTATQEGATQKKSSPSIVGRSEEHTSELQSRGHLVCRL